VCKNSSNMSLCGTIQWIANKPPNSAHVTHYHSLDPIWIHYNILWISFASTCAHFRVILAGELPFSTCSFPLPLIVHLDYALVGGLIGMSKELVSTSKNFPSNDFDQKSIICYISTCYSTSASTFVVFFSTCFSSS
jgi:hypothetical protein